MTLNKPSQPRRKSAPGESAITRHAAPRSQLWAGSPLIVFHGLFGSLENWHTPPSSLVLRRRLLFFPKASQVAVANEFFALLIQQAESQ